MLQQIPNNLSWNLGATVSNLASKGSRFLGKAFLQDDSESAYNFSLDREETYFKQFTYNLKQRNKILEDDYVYISHEMPQNHQRRLDYLQRKGIDLQRQRNSQEIAKNQGKVERVLSNIEETKQRTQIMNNMMKNLPASHRQPYDPGQLLEYNFTPFQNRKNEGGKKKRTSKRKIKRKRTSKRRIKRKVY